MTAYTATCHASLRWGQTAKALTKKSVFVAGEHQHILGWAVKHNIRQCTQCQKWGHTHSICKARSSYCTICGDLHPTSVHFTACGRCINAHQPPSHCLHRYCINCGGEHSATDTACACFQARGKPAQFKALQDARTASILVSQMA